MIERRSLIKGLVALVAAPAIVKVASLMPVNAKPPLARISGSWQTGVSLYVDPLLEPLGLGDIITIDGVREWRRYFAEIGPTDRLRQFVVTARAEAGQRVVYLYPPILGGHNYRRTVVDLPMNKAILSKVSFVR